MSTHTHTQKAHQKPTPQIVNCFPPSPAAPLSRSLESAACSAAGAGLWGGRARSRLSRRRVAGEAEAAGAAPSPGCRAPAPALQFEGVLCICSSISRCFAFPNILKLPQNKFSEHLTIDFSNVSFEISFAHFSKHEAYLFK